jgi:signal transduction histidine kinase
MKKLWVLSKKALVVILRWLLFFIAVYLTAGKEGTGRGFFALLALFALSNLALGVASQEMFHRWRLNYLVVAFDVFFISVAIWITGDLDLYIFYFFTILMSSYGRQVQGSILTAVVASALYAWMAYQQGHAESLLNPDLLMRLPFFYLVALMSSFMAQESREEEERFAWTRVVLSMTQELGLCRERRQLFQVLAAALSRLPGVKAVRVFFRDAAGWRDAGEGAEAPAWEDAALGLESREDQEGPQSVAELASRRGPSPHPAGMRSAVLCPFALRGGAAGLLAVYSTRLEGFRERAQETVGVAAQSVARSLDNLEAFARIEERAREVGALLQVSAVINSSLDFGEVLARLLSESTKLVGAEASALLLVDEVSGELVFQVATGGSEDRLRAVRLKPGEGLAGWVARENRPAILNDPRSDPRFCDAIDHHTRFATRNVMAAPLTVRGRVIGVLEVVNRSPAGPFTSGELDLLQLLAEQTGTAVEKARLHRHMEEQVNETIQMYLALEKEKGKIETILASMIEGVLVADEAGAVALVNHSARRALSSDGTAWMPEYGHVVELLGRAVAERAEFEQSLSPDLPGHRIYKARIAPMVTGMGKLLGAVAVLEDVTELTRLSALKSEFISQVSHELRTPLTAIRAALNLMARGRTGPLTEQQADLAAMVQEETGRMAGLINDLLDLSKIESGMMRLEPEEVDLQNLVSRIVESLRVLAVEKEITVVLEIPSALRPVRADQRRLERVFVNLLSNAVKYSPQGSSVRVGAEETGGAELPAVRCWVRDNGPGIAEEDRVRIFEKFERGSASAIKGVMGTGLGLAIARGIVEEHGGRIWVESRLGEGSTFCFTLPRSATKGETGGSGAILAPAAR